MNRRAFLASAAAAAIAPSIPALPAASPWSLAPGAVNRVPLREAQEYLLLENELWMDAMRYGTSYYRFDGRSAPTIVSPTEILKGRLP